jgi:hypothetical protein
MNIRHHSSRFSKALKAQVVVLSPRDVVLPEPTDRPRIDEPALPNSLKSEQLVDDRSQVFRQPGANGGAESRFATPDDILREDALLAPA